MCGIGGSTIAQAVHAISWPEFLSWCRYRNKYGSFNLGMRVDRAVGRALAEYFSAHSKNQKYSVSDFSPFDKIIKDNMPIDQQIDMALSHFPRK